MDSVNNHEDKIVRAKAKAMIMKVKKGTVERPPMPEISNQVATDPNSDNQDQAIKIEDPFEKVKKVITEKKIYPKISLIARHTTSPCSC